MATIKFNTRQVRAKVAEATVLGVEQTMSECVRDARAAHPAYPPASRPGERYANRTGFLAASTDIREPAELHGDRVTGRWGSNADYALYVEIGTSRKDSGMPRAQVREAQGGGDMNAIPGPSDPPLMAARPTLRPAADGNYPQLGARIGVNYRA